MSIYGAINSATTGLDAQSQALENISGNVANSSTTGYKRLDTSFSDLVSSTGSRQADQVAGTVYATSRATNTQQGDVSSYDVETYMAINGSGYFVVTDADGLTNLSPSYKYTRAGDFELDEDRYLVNASGYYLQGYPVNTTTGAVADKFEPIRISDQPMPAQPSEQIDYQANLPSTPSTERYNPDVPSSKFVDPSVFATTETDTSISLVNGTGDVLSVDDNLVDVAAFDLNDVFDITVDGSSSTFTIDATTTIKDFLDNLNQYNGVSADIDATGQLTISTSVPLTIGENTGDPLGGTPISETPTSNVGGGPVDTTQVAAKNNSTFIDSTISGGSVTVYDTNGTPINVEMRWSLDSEDNWSLFYNSAPSATGDDTAWSKIGNVAFDAAGRMVSPADGNMTIPDLNVNGVSAGDIILDFGTNNLTQYDDTVGFATSVDIEQDGYASGELVGISINSDGMITGNYSNSKSQDLYRVPIATFAAEQELQRIDGSAFAATPTSGEPDFRNGGTIRAKALEASNADIAKEFSKLIITQQAYSANSRVLSTANTMLDAVLNIVR
ncbi:flagellar hook-basal body complex protein [Pseudovibrio sp. SPO723]|uniref:flagellar hook protein FlgE n=1 Tax=Nesiotobacter zosterae TaxID=392721 RepID=UPI0029C519DD|nr:flagellar hook-basal body complex protein [Pseudovibrio sp. SPO723]MDX5594138.1 flagellar hook-basal body complex protein [Pseudovibrio sp. SPO723]